MAAGDQRVGFWPWCLSTALLARGESTRPTGCSRANNFGGALAILRLPPMYVARVLRGIGPALHRRRRLPSFFDGNTEDSSVCAAGDEPRVCSREIQTMNEMQNGTPRPQRRRPGDRTGSSSRQRNGLSGNAQKNYERYLARAQEARLAGDTVEMENCYQHAEHYLRVMREHQA